MSNYRYKSDFFDFVDVSSGKSASLFLSHLDFGFTPSTVLDVGCGRGVWLKAWKEQGVNTVLGLDGDYVDISALLISNEEFIPIDISQSFDLGRKFELAECLEVAEHIFEESADTLITSLVNHSNLVLFSAASPGQGGEHHVNEQKISYWAEKFRSRGFSAFDFPRSVVQNVVDIEPWYRFNTILYANSEGQLKLSKAVKETQVLSGSDFFEYAPFSWRFRCGVVRRFPFSLVNILAKLKHRAIT